MKAVVDNIVAETYEGLSVTTGCGCWLIRSPGHASRFLRQAGKLLDRERDVSRLNSSLFEIAYLLVRLSHVAYIIIEAGCFHLRFVAEIGITYSSPAYRMRTSGPSLETSSRRVPTGSTLVTIETDCLIVTNCGAGDEVASPINLIALI